MGNWYISTGESGTTWYSGSHNNQIVYCKLNHGKIEAERALVESSKKLIEIYEQKMKDAIAKLWSD